MLSVELRGGGARKHTLAYPRCRAYIAVPALCRHFVQFQRRVEAGEVEGARAAVTAEEVASTVTRIAVVMVGL